MAGSGIDHNSRQSTKLTTPQVAPSSPNKDKTFRLVAFIFTMISVAICGIDAILAPISALVDSSTNELGIPVGFIVALNLIPLAWIIPMGVHMYKIYKGEKKNTIAFGVCTLIFCNLISGILLLCSKKDR